MEREEGERERERERERVGEEEEKGEGEGEGEGEEKGEEERDGERMKRERVKEKHEKPLSNLLPSEANVEGSNSVSSLLRSFSSCMAPMTSRLSSTVRRGTNISDVQERGRMIPR